MTGAAVTGLAVTGARRRRRRHGSTAVLLAVGLTTLAGCADDPGPAIASLKSGNEDTVATTKAASGSVLEQYIDDMQVFVGCLRENGLTSVPDPDEYGQVRIDTSQLSDRSVLNEARLACQSVAVPMPDEVRDLLDDVNAAGLSPEDKRTYQEYADCMQANGADDFPDPAANGMPRDVPWDQTSAGAQRATAACAPIIGDSPSQGAGVG